MPTHKSAALETKIYEQQCDQIKRAHGKLAADMANYGWAVIVDPDMVDVSTKVYGHTILRSVGNRHTGKITHEWL